MNIDGYSVEGEYAGCPVCAGVDQEYCQELQVLNDARGFDCFVCGKFRVSGTALADETSNGNLRLSELERAVLSHRLRVDNDLHSFAIGDAPMITSDTISRMKQATIRLPLVTSQLRNLLRAIGDEIQRSSVPPFPNGRHKSRSGVLSMDHLRRLFQSGVDAGFLTVVRETSRINTRRHNVIGKEFDLTLKGWEEYEASLSGLRPGKYGFLAMKFGDPNLEKFVSEHLKPKVESLTGYRIIDLREVSKAGVIDNLMRQYIRDSAFLISDLTHDNLGAYWESGYAEGLGKPVIYLCEREKFSSAKTHFDTNHCTTVMWDLSDIDQFIAELSATIRRSLNLF